MQYKNISEDKEALKRVIADKDAYISQLEERIRLLNSVIFGSKSEKSSNSVKQDQYTLFDEAEDPEAEASKEEPLVTVPAHERKKSRPQTASGRLAAQGRHPRPSRVREGLRVRL